MKRLFVLLFLQTAIAQAADLNLYCDTKDKQFIKTTNQSRVVVKSALSEEADIDIVDAPLMDSVMEKDGFQIVSFSNQCDNFYELKIPNHAVRTALETGRAKVAVEVTYFNSEFDEDMFGQDAKANFRCFLQAR